MAYRLYALRPSDLRIAVATNIEALDDDTAIRAAWELYPATPFEIWYGARRVIRSAHDPAA
jgi:hypothetical protein